MHESLVNYGGNKNPEVLTGTPMGPVVVCLDVILALEMNDAWGALHSFSDPYKTYRPHTRPNAKVLTIRKKKPLR
jgi:hypothetical protein